MSLTDTNKSERFKTHMNNKYLALKMYSLLKSMFYSQPLTVFSVCHHISLNHRLNDQERKPL